MEFVNKRRHMLKIQLLTYLYKYHDPSIEQLETAGYREHLDAVYDGDLQSAQLACLNELGTWKQAIYDATREVTGIDFPSLSEEGTREALRSLGRLPEDTGTEPLDLLYLRKRKQLVDDGEDTSGYAPLSVERTGYDSRDIFERLERFRSQLTTDEIFVHDNLITQGGEYTYDEVAIMAGLTMDDVYRIEENVMRKQELQDDQN